MGDYSRPSLNEVMEKHLSFVKGKTFLCPIGNNKGKPGLLYENLCGIPNSTACLDCQDGEVKCYPLAKIKSRSSLSKTYSLEKGDYLPKETVAITMVNRNSLSNTKFEDSNLSKKISNIMFVPYIREGDHIEYHDYIIFNKEHSLFPQIVTDYNDIREFYEKEGFEKGTVSGELLQIRPKGSGGKSPKTYAFYFKRKFIIELRIMNQ